MHALEAFPALPTECGERLHRLQPATAATNFPNALACPKGQLRHKDGQCRSPKPKIGIKPFLLDHNDGLH